jgi:hypothetical protein
MGLSYAGIGLCSRKDGIYLEQYVANDAGKGSRELGQIISKQAEGTIYFRVTVTQEAKCRFSYSLDGKVFTPAGEVFTAQPGRWKGAKVGIYAVRDSQTNDSGYADFDWFRIEPIVN